MLSPPIPGELGSSFAATRWSIVLAAGNPRAGTAARHAMGELARLYWFPLYAYVRRSGHNAPEAEDVVQSFFTRLMEKDILAVADRTRGKFRSFLLASLKNFLANEWDKARTQKRGGGGELLELDSLNAERRYATEPADHATPERVFERRWALALLDQVLARLQSEYSTRDQTALFAALQASLVGGQKAHHATIAKSLGMTEGAVKVAAHRLRRRYRDLLREEISQTLADPTQTDEEIRHLMASL